MRPVALFLESVPITPEQEKYCVDVSYTRGTGMHNVTRISHRMKKQKFGVTCLDALFLEYVPVPPEQEL
jgi:hypothetical protein